MPMQVAELWRYPVKSLRGQRLEVVDVDEAGIPGDRLVHVRQQSGRVVTARFRHRLLGLQGSLGDDGEPRIEGQPWDSAAARELVRAAAGPGVELVRYTGDDHGQRYDVLPLTVLTTGMVDVLGVDRRRFRPNILIAGTTTLEEAGWPGYGLRAGTALIGVRNRRMRCVMTTFDPDTLEQDLGVLQWIYREASGEAALDCWVVEPGRIAEGDAVELVELEDGVEPPLGNGTEPFVWSRRRLAPR